MKNRLRWENLHNTDGAENYEVFLCNDVTLLDALSTLGANQTEQVTTLTPDTNCQTGTRGLGNFADIEGDCFSYWKLNMYTINTNSPVLGFSRLTPKTIQYTREFLTQWRYLIVGVGSGMISDQFICEALNILYIGSKRRECFVSAERAKRTA